ncbi:MAG: O-antigen ligase family protein [Candidatus Promineifilaceae bacterium]
MALNFLNYDANARSLEGQALNQRIRRNLWQGGFLAFTVYVTVSMLQTSYISYTAKGLEIDFAIVAWFLLLIGLSSILYEPRFGVYLTLPLSLAGDPVMTWWYPFDVNFSSEESLLFLHNSLIISPLEAFLIVTLLSWLGRILLFHRDRLREHITTGPLFIPVLIFTLFVLFGLFYGVVINGGDAKIALWESRSILYLPLIFFLTTNLIVTRKHLKTLVWAIITGIFVEGALGTRFFLVVMNASLAGYTDIMDHPAAIHMNAAFVYCAAVWLYQVSYSKRFIIIGMLPFIGLTYMAAQRRSAFVSLGIALGLLLCVLFKLNRKLFFVAAPTAALVGVLYLGAFWNSGSALALPAQAIKSVIAPDAVGEADSDSNRYRIVENANSQWTIRNNFLTGVGFGNKFWILIPMADISFFEWWEYITHNSILWIWMKMGVGGFVSMLMMVALSLMRGSEMIWKMPNNELGAIASWATLYLVMHFMYAYVDISWSHQNMLFAGTTIAILNIIEAVEARPIPIPKPRWAWMKVVDPNLE